MVERKNCSVCGGKYSQILDHVRKEHNYEVSLGQALRMGLCSVTVFFAVFSAISWYLSYLSVSILF